MSAVATRPEIVAFAAAVREQLDDLPADDVDELTGGLEADLSDQAAEAGDDFTIPDAAAYAAELRAAAGLPERTTSKRARRAIRERWAAASAHVIGTVRAYALGAWVLDTLIALRPVWWLIRAATLYLLVVPLISIPRPTANDMVDRALALQTDPAAVALFAVLLLLSIQWGRGKWVPLPWLRIVRTVVSVIAVLALPLLLVAITDARGALSYVSVADQNPNTYTPGLAVDGQRVRNIFAYDANGNPIEHAQLFDQDGVPLTTVGPSGQSDEWDYYFFGGGGPAPAAEREIGRQPVWNVFPLRELPVAAWEQGYPDDTDDAVAPIFPFGRVPAVADATTTSGTAVDTVEAQADPVPTASPVP